MSNSVEFLHSEDLQDESQWYADAQGCTYVPFVYFGGNDVQCTNKCLNVLSVSTFLTQKVDASMITPEMVGKTFVLSFWGLARQVSAASGDGVVSFYATDGTTTNIVTLPLTSQNETHAKFTSVKVDFKLSEQARNGFNITMKLRDTNAPNKATLYFDQLSLKPDAVVLVEHKTPMSAIIGGAVGGAALLIALGIFLFLYIMKRRKDKRKKEEAEKGKGRGDSEDPLTVPNPFVDHRPSMSVVQSPYPAESALYSPRSPNGNVGLPNYGAPSFISQQQGLDLDGFARENPYLIDTVLLEKLRRARYSPAQHPTVIPESEWLSRYNIDKIEYERLCEAYSKTYEQGQEGTSG